MQVLRVEGGHPLDGCVRIHGSKNGVLPLIAASILTNEPVVLERCPVLTDVETSVEILRALGAAAELDTARARLRIEARTLTAAAVPEVLMRRLRASVLFLGALLAREGEATLSVPGGCALGERPIDLHLSLVRQMGGEVAQDGDEIRCKAAALHGGTVYLSYPSVGATENFLLLAQRCTEPVRLMGAAMEPEIVELAAFLNAMGAHVDGAGTPILSVAPHERLHGLRFEVLPDRIEAATLLCCTLGAGGSMTLEGLAPQSMLPVLDVLWQTDCEIVCGEDWVRLRATGRPRAPERVTTAPWPGFPTDVQAPLTAALLKCRGTAIVREQVFSARFHHVPELRRMGAQIETDGHMAVIRGVAQLRGTQLQGIELRGTAALVTAALGAEGESEIQGLEYLDRGYVKLHNSLQNCGAAIKRVEIS